MVLCYSPSWTVNIRILMRWIEMPQIAGLLCVLRPVNGCFHLMSEVRLCGLCCASLSFMGLQTVNHAQDLFSFWCKLLVMTAFVPCSCAVSTSVPTISTSVPRISTCVPWISIVYLLSLLLTLRISSHISKNWGWDFLTASKFHCLLQHWKTE